MNDLEFIDIRLLYRKMTGEKLGERDERAFEEWYEASDDHKAYYEHFCRQQEKIMTGERSDVDTGKGFLFLRKKNRKRLLRLTLRNARWAAAVVLLLIAGVGIFFLDKNGGVEKGQLASAAGESRFVTLRLATGRQIVLDSLSQGRIIRRDSGVVISLEDGELRYKGEEEMAPSRDLQYNELRVPAGGEFVVTLADGTKAILNSSTRLYYPLRFGEDERRVKLDGEAYFVVAKDKIPFIVDVGLEEVKVFGTEFNVMAYADEEVVQTTLVEGSVGVRVKNKTGGEFRKIEPGEQFRLNRKTSEVQVVKVDVFPYVAWKDGLFVSKNDNLEMIMRKIERWFDVEVFYRNPGLKEKRFFGIMKKQTCLRDMLEIVGEAGDVRFEVNGKTVVVGEK